METHKNLIVWQKSIAFVTSVYEFTKSYPREEMYGITSQIRRAAVSIPSNMAEGCASWIYWIRAKTTTTNSVRGNYEDAPCPDKITICQNS